MVVNGRDEKKRREKSIFVGNCFLVGKKRVAGIIKLERKRRDHENLKDGTNDCLFVSFNISARQLHEYVISSEAF